MITYNYTKSCICGILNIDIFCLIRNCSANFLLNKKALRAGCALARSENAAALGARMSQATFFVLFYEAVFEENEGKKWIDQRS